MKQITFYIIEENSQADHDQGLIEFSLSLAQHFVAQGAKVYIHAQDKQQAEQIDETCFAAPLTQFIAHNLVGEGPKFGCPIEIGYHSAQQSIRPHFNRNLVINLANGVTNFAHQFTQVVDFVPNEKKAKQEARERYKIYRQAGFSIQTITLNSVNERNEDKPRS